MDSPGRQAALQYTEQMQTKQKTQHRKLKHEQHRARQKNHGVDPDSL